MQRRESESSRIGLLVSLAALGLLLAIIVIPHQFRSEAVGVRQTSKGLITKTLSHEPGLEYYDIRTHKSDEVTETLLRFRSDTGTTSYAIADVWEGFVRGEEELRSRVGSLKVEYTQDLRNPEVITPDVWRNEIETLTGPSEVKRAEVLRSFVKENDQLIGVNGGQADQLKVIADYENPAGNMAFAHLVQEIDGIPIFRGEIKAGFKKDGSMIRVINNLAPGLEYNGLSREFGDPLEAVKAAAGYINYDLKKPDVTRNEAASSDLRTVFGQGPSATTAEKMYFPTEIGVARPSWRVLIWQPVNAYYVIVDAETGTMLWRKNITEDQTQSATYEIYNNTNAFMQVADSPAPLTPGPIDPGLGTQGAILARSNVALIGNEGPLSFNDLGWITDGANGMNGHTDGNATEAGLDIDGTDGVDAPVAGVNRVFSTMWNPPPGNPTPGDAPTVQAARDGAVIQMFYTVNRYHDALYMLGFNEAALNFQNDNFMRGGAAGDRIRSEGQDSSGTNNANFSTPSDGGRGRMQMFVFTGPTPDRDGTADVDVIVHELTHGTSNRLHGNAAGLNQDMARGMGEGWSDFYSHALQSEPTDPINGIYTTGGYVTFNSFGLGTTNYYYGIRSQPKAVMAFTGGPMNRPHNSLTFADIDSTTANNSDGAFPAAFGPNFASPHFRGEVWSSALWEIRALMVTRLGFQAGNTRVLQVVTDGMKLAPIDPTFIQERDAIMAAAAALPLAPEAAADTSDVREGFRIRGMGFSASVQSTSPVRVTEAFDLPNVRHVDPFSVSDAPGDNDGAPEPGEDVLLSIPISNTTGATITNVTANVNGGANVAYGTITDGQTVTMQIPYTIPGGAACGGFHQVQINMTSDVEAAVPVTRQFRLGAPLGGPPQTFTNATAIDLPAGQPGTSSGPAGVYPSTINVTGQAGLKNIRVTLNGISHTFPADLDMLLEGPGGQKYIFLSDSGGGGDAVALNFDVVDSASAQPSTSQWTAGEWRPYNSGANDPFDAPAPAGPYTNAAPAGTDTFTSVFGQDSSMMNGDWKLWIDDDAGGDSGSIAGGWSITFEATQYICNLASENVRADFDADGRTDISVFRPSDGVWYLNGSTDGLFGFQWGQAGDVLVPGDYDGDLKTDVAVARLTDTPGEADFFVLNSNGFTVSGFEWGQTGDVPVVGDFNGDGNDDITVYRPSNNTWYSIVGVAQVKITQFGNAGDVPAVADYDGDGTDDIATFNAGVFRAMLSNGSGTLIRNVGGNIVVSGDYDGDNKDDPAAFDTANGNWRIRLSGSNSQQVVQFGLGTDKPVPGDYDGDGRHDLAIFRNGEWWIYSSLNVNVSVSFFGFGTDLPLPPMAKP